MRNSIDQPCGRKTCIMNSLYCHLSPLKFVLLISWARRVPLSSPINWNNNFAFCGWYSLPPWLAINLFSGSWSAFELVACKQNRFRFYSFTASSSFWPASSSRQIIQIDSSHTRIDSFEQGPFWRPYGQAKLNALKQINFLSSFWTKDPDHWWSSFLARISPFFHAFSFSWRINVLRLSVNLFELR